VNDDKSPADRLLDLAVFGPAGLAVTVVEEFPMLVEKGRHRVEGHVHTARLVGQFAVQMGRRQMEQSLAHLGSRSAQHGATADGTTEARGTQHQPYRPPDFEPTHGDAPAPLDASRVPRASSGHGGATSSSSLAIPGYNSLSASQVVQRLEGLSSPELEEVRAHEAAHRQRSTILHRVEQLLTGGDDVQA
jgi:hypothetical protein